MGTTASNVLLPYLSLVTTLLTEFVTQPTSTIWKPISYYENKFVKPSQAILFPN